MAGANRWTTFRNRLWLEDIAFDSEVARKACESHRVRYPRTGFALSLSTLVAGSIGGKVMQIQRVAVVGVTFFCHGNCSRKRSPLSTHNFQSLAIPKPTGLTGFP